MTYDLTVTSIVTKETSDEVQTHMFTYYTVTHREMSLCKSVNANSNKQHKAGTWQVQITFCYHKSNSK